MAFDKKGLDDYVDVATRITEFRAKYPDGYLAPLDYAVPYRIEQVADRVFVVVIAAAYRAPGDTSPGVGMAWEPFPGRTPYTKDSELMNAETSAWGRAIIALGAADAKRGIASREEVRNRQDNPFDNDADATKGSSWHPPANPSSRKFERPPRGPLPADQWTTAPPDGNGPESQPGSSTPEQRRDIAIRLSKRGLTTRPDRLGFCSETLGAQVGSTEELSYADAEKILKAAS